MAKFKYKMQNILDIKQKLEEQAKMRFAQEMMKLNEEEDKLKIIQYKKLRYEAEGVALRKKTLNARSLKENNEAINIIRDEITAQEKNVALAQKNVEKARERLREAMQERKTHERLAEEAFEDFKREIGAQESKEVDELTSYTYGIRQVKNNDKDLEVNRGGEG